jgi:hypothetical protein
MHDLSERDLAEKNLAAYLQSPKSINRTLAFNN